MSSFSLISQRLADYKRCALLPTSKATTILESDFFNKLIMQRKVSQTVRYRDKLTSSRSSVDLGNSGASTPMTSLSDSPSIAPSNPNAHLGFTEVDNKLGYGPGEVDSQPSSATNSPFTSRLPSSSNLMSTNYTAELSELARSTRFSDDGLTRDGGYASDESDSSDPWRLTSSSVPPKRDSRDSRDKD